MSRGHDAAVVAAHTGILMGRFDDCHGYIEELMGRPVWAHEIPALAHELEERETIDGWAFRNEGRDRFVALARRWMEEDDG
jgi:hypothetical protein